MFSRRALLTIAGTALFAACSRATGPAPPTASRRPTPAPTSASGSATVLELPVRGELGAVRGLLPAFNAAQTAARAAAAVASAETEAHFRLIDVPEYGVVQMGAQGALAPLDAALRAANFDPGGVAPGSVATLSVAGRTLALPVTQQPWAVQWRPDVFAAAGLADPAPDWTLADFETACATLTSHAKGGKAPAITAALAPFLGSYSMPLGPGDIYTTPGAPGLWVGFVRGFGGSPVAGGDFHLGGTQTLAGLQRLLADRPADRCRRAGPGAGGPDRRRPGTPAGGGRTADERCGGLHRLLGRTGVGLNPGCAAADIVCPGA